MKHSGQTKRTNLTLPNLLTLLRLWLILPIILLYLWGHPVWAAGLLVLSGITDLADGFVARRFHLVSDVGKVLDPIADKLTQLAVMFCLVVRFPVMLAPLLLLLFKEICTGLLCLVAIQKTGEVMSADWHGKLTTLLLYAMMMVHFLWENIPALVSNVSIAVCMVMLLLSFILYAVRHIKAMEASAQKPSAVK